MIIITVIIMSNCQSCSTSNHNQKVNICKNTTDNNHCISFDQIVLNYNLKWQDSWTGMLLLTDQSNLTMFSSLWGSRLCLKSFKCYRISISMTIFLRCKQHAFSGCWRWCLIDNYDVISFCCANDVIMLAWRLIISAIFSCPGQCILQP